MITVPQAAMVIIKRSRYLSEALSKDIINLSALAEYIQPEIEQMLFKKVSKPSILMALKRLKPEFKPRFQNYYIFTTPPTLTTRSNLFEMSIKNSLTLDSKLQKVFSSITPHSFFTISKSSQQTTCIVSQELTSFLDKILRNEEIISRTSFLSSISVELPDEARKTSGIYYFFIKSLAWEGVNIIEMVSTKNQLLLFFEDKTIERAFSIIKSLFENKEIESK